jgi:hypothetical protein
MQRSAAGAQVTNMLALADGQVTVILVVRRRLAGDERTDFSQGWIRLLGVGGTAAGLGGLAQHPGARADELPPGSDFQGSIIQPNATQSPVTCPTLVNGRVIQPQRELAVLHQTDVLDHRPCGGRCGGGRRSGRMPHPRGRDRQVAEDPQGAGSLLGIEP